MAASGQVIERMAKASGLLPSTLDRMLRPLREAGLVPMGEKGRGRAKGQYEPQHLANLLLSFAGHQPSDAAEAAKALGDMEYWPDPRMSAGVPAGQKLLDTLAELIDRLGHFILEQHSPGALERDPRLPWMIGLNLTSPRRGRVWWDAAQHDSYVPKGTYRTHGGVSRETSLDRWMIIAAAELWADSLAQRGGLDLPPPISGGDATSPEKSETPEPRHRAPASLRNNRPRKPKAGQSDSSENNSACAFTQARWGARGFPTQEPPPDEVRN